MSDRRVSVRVDADVSAFQRGLASASASAKAFAKELESSDRHAVSLGSTLVGFAPALVPIGAAAVPALSGLTAALGAASAGAGVAVMAFQGVGDALDALNDYQLEPTVENMEKVRQEFDKIGPAGEQFVRYLDSLGPQLGALQDTAREGLFPGVEDGIDSLMTLLPQARDLVSSLAAAMGDLARDAGAGLSGDGFEAFIDYIRTDAATTLEQLGHTIGNVAEGFGSIMVGLAPLTRDFNAGLESMSRAFADWAAEMASTDGFRSFIDYVRQEGPQVLRLIGTLGDAFVEVLQAAAPVGGALIPMLTGIAEALGAIADSPIGPVLFSAVTAFAAIKSISGAAGGALEFFGASTEAATVGAAGLSKALTGLAAILGGMAVVDSLQTQFEGLSTGLEGTTRQLLELANSDTTKLSGDFSDIADSFQRLADPNAAQALQDGIYNTFGFLGSDSRVDKAKAQLDAIDQSLANIVGRQGVDEAARAFEALAESMGLSGDEQEELLGMLPTYRDALAGAANQADELGSATDKAGTFAQRSVAKWQAHQDALQASREAAKETTDQFLTLGDSLNDAKTSFDGWIRDMQSQANALRDFTHNAMEAARKGLDEGLIKSLQEAGPEGALRMRQLADGAEAGIDRANRAWRSGQRAAREYADTLGGLRDPDLDVNSGPMERKLRKAMADLRAFGLTKAQAELLIQDLASGKVKNVQQLIDHYGMSKKSATALLNDLASGKIRGIQGLLNSLHDKTITINTVHTTSYTAKRQGIMDAQGYSADGGSVPKDSLPYGDRYLYMLAPGEEIISNRFGQADQFRADRAAGRIPGYADGGTTGGRGAPVGGGNGGGLSDYNLDDRGIILGLLQQIRDLNRDLRRKGKEHLEGLDRRVAETQLEAARHDLRAAKHREEREKRQKERERERETRRGVRDALSNFSLDSIIPDDRPVTLEGQTRGALRDLKAEILDAGGEWTKGMRRWAKGLIAQASELDDVNKALDAEQQHRDDLVQTLQDQQQALEQLRSTMQQFSDQVAGNFTVGSLPGRTTRTVDGTVDPALSSRLSAAEQRLIAIRSSAGGDSVANAAEASRLMGQIEDMRAEVESQSQPVEQTVDAYHSLREQLISQTADAKQFADALSSLSSMGLNADLFAQIASSGDLATALDLLSGGQAGINDINSLWRQNAEAAAQVAAYATQEVYGPEQAALMAQIDAQNQLIDASTAAIELLNATAKVLGRDVRQGAAAGVAPLGNEIRDLKVTVLGAIRDIPRQQHENKKKAGR